MKKVINKRFYVYSVTKSSLAAAATSTHNVTIASDSNFLLTKMTCFADIAGAVQTDSSRVIPLVTVQLTEATSENAMFSAPTPIGNIFGTGQIPFILPEPKIFTPNSNLQVDLSNFSAATTYNLRLAFIGYKLYYSDSE